MKILYGAEMQLFDWSAYQVRLSPDHARAHARLMTSLHALTHPEYRRVLTDDERREQYADYYARTIMRLTA